MLILGSARLDVADIDRTTLAFGPGAATPTHPVSHPLSERNGDGFDDMIVHFAVQETGVAAGDSELCLSGELLDGSPIEGCDSIVTVSRRACGFGFEIALLLAPLLLWRRRLAALARAARAEDSVR